MLWLMWCYFGLSAVHFSQGQRRALVNYAIVTAKPTADPPDTSAAANAISRAQVTTPARRSEVRSRPNDPSRTRAVNASRPDTEGTSTALPSIQKHGKTNDTVLNSKDEFISTTTSPLLNSSVISLDYRNDTARVSSEKPPVLLDDDVRVPDFERDSSRPASRRRDRDDDDSPSSTGRNRGRLGDDRLLKGDSKVYLYDDGFRDEIPRTRGDDGDSRDPVRDSADRPRYRDDYLEPRRSRGSATAYDEKGVSDDKRWRDDDRPYRRGDADDEVYRDRGDREYYPRRDRVSSEDRVRSDRDYPARKRDGDYEPRRDKTDDYQPRKDRTDDYTPSRRDSSSTDRDYPSRRDKIDTDYSTRDRDRDYISRDRDDRDYSRDRTDYSAKDRTDRDDRYYPSRSDRDRIEKRGDSDRDLPRRDSSDSEYRSEKTKLDISPARDISGRGDIRDSPDRVNRDRGEIDRFDSVTGKLDRDLKTAQPSRDTDISATRNRDRDTYYSAKGDEPYNGRSRIRIDRDRYDDDSYLEKGKDQAQEYRGRDYDRDDRRRIIVDSDRSRRPDEERRRTDDDIDRSKGDSYYSRNDERRRDDDRYTSRSSEEREYRDDRVPVREDRYKEDSRRDDLVRVDRDDRVPVREDRYKEDSRRDDLVRVPLLSSKPVGSNSERQEPSIPRKPLERDGYPDDGIITSSRDRISPSRVSGTDLRSDNVDSKPRDSVPSSRVSEGDRYRYRDEDTRTESRDRISPSRVRSEGIDEPYSRSRDSLRPSTDDRIREQDRDEARRSSSYDGKSRSRPVGDDRDIVLESRSYASDDEYRRSNDGSRYPDRGPADERRRYSDDDYYPERPKVRSQEDSKRRYGDDDAYSEGGPRKDTSGPRSDRRNAEDSRGPRPGDMDERYQGRGDSGRSEIRHPSVERDSSRAISVKDVIDGALHRSDVTDRDSKEVLYPVFNPKVYNLTSSDIIRPNERRGITIASKRKR